mmetsp:Transcript_30039/g.46524  ORF Transcript_30039/g.46524 Transcript_30039/m.46524 type:complete len:531 (-) Transcript_30039:18-1610(-)
MTFDQRFEKAFFVSEHYFKKFSGLSGGFHPSYKPLFRKLWIQQDPNQTGSFTSLSQCENFARGMVDNKWSDWAPSEKDRKIWSALLAIHGKIEIEEFARVAEDEDYQIPEPALITPAHTAWKQQGGDNPGAPSSGQARFQTIDWSKPREQVSKEIHDALKKDGFFLLKNHGINPTLISSSLSNSREFFARRKFAKEEEIRQIAIQESMRPMMKCARGYSDIRTEALNPVQGPDVKETFDYSLQSSDSPSPSSSSSSSSSCMSKMHLGPNLWPSEITPVNVLSGPSIALAPSGFRDKCEEYQSAVYKLSMELLQIICEGVELSKEQINQEIMPMFQDPLVVSRLIHYPPQGRFATPKTPSYNRYQPFPSLSRYPEPQQQQQQQQDQPPPQFPPPQDDSDPHTWSVPKLKRILRERHIDYTGIFEKADLVDLVLNPPPPSPSPPPSSSPPSSPVPSSPTPPPSPPPSPSSQRCDTPPPLEKMDMECVICLTEAKSVLFFPCGHLCSCAGCADVIAECPICRAHIRQRVKAYL